MRLSLKGSCIVFRGHMTEERGSIITIPDSSGPLFSSIFPLGSI